MRSVVAWISCVAVLVGVQNLMAAPRPVGVRETFKTLDKNNDKKLSFEEYLNKRSDEEGDYRKRFDFVDRDNDRRMSFDEFKAEYDRGSMSGFTRSRER